MPVQPRGTGNRIGRTDKQAVHHLICAHCCWPECDQPGWPEANLPLCHRHAARAHLAVADMLPEGRS